MVMKTYLFETLNCYKRFSESLDAKAVLSNKAWVVVSALPQQTLLGIIIRTINKR